MPAKKQSVGNCRCTTYITCGSSPPRLIPATLNVTITPAGFTGVPSTITWDPTAFSGVGAWVSGSTWMGSPNGACPFASITMRCSDATAGQTMLRGNANNTDAAPFGTHVCSPGTALGVTRSFSPFVLTARYSIGATIYTLTIFE